MTSTAHYPEMHQLFGAYLNQDDALWGDSIERDVDCYRRDSTPHQVASLAEELRRFRASHPDNLDAAFKSAHGFDVDPALWASTPSSFFDDLVRQLSAPAAPDGARH